MHSSLGRIRFIALLALSASGAAPSREDKPTPDKPVRFTGELARGHEFRRSIGQGLIFALSPDSSDPSEAGGWTITIAPEKPAGNAACKDFAWVVMPPYRDYNQRYLNTTYGTMAWQAIAMSPREFSFVLNSEDCRAEAAWVSALLFSNAPPEKEFAEARAKLGSSPRGRGNLWIDKSKISRAAHAIDGVNYGSIDWIQFHVEIRFP
jgi:hypothetical protein